MINPLPHTSLASAPHTNPRNRPMLLMVHIEYCSHRGLRQVRARERLFGSTPMVLKVESTNVGSSQRRQHVKVKSIEPVSSIKQNSSMKRIKEYQKLPVSALRASQEMPASKISLICVSERDTPRIFTPSIETGAIPAFCFSSDSGLACEC